VNPPPDSDVAGLDATGLVAHSKHLARIGWLGDSALAPAHRPSLVDLDRRRERATSACPCVEGLTKTSPSFTARSATPRPGTRRATEALRGGIRIMRFGDCSRRLVDLTDPALHVTFW
jgi:hypothetical protein